MTWLRDVGLKFHNWQTEALRRRDGMTSLPVTSRDVKSTFHQTLIPTAPITVLNSNESTVTSYNQDDMHDVHLETIYTQSHDVTTENGDVRHDFHQNKGRKEDTSSSKSLLSLWREAREARENPTEEYERRVAKRSNVIGAALFLYVGIISTIISIIYVIPHEYSEYQARYILFQRILVIFLFTQSLLNWTLLKRTSTAYCTTKHQSHNSAPPARDVHQSHNTLRSPPARGVHQSQNTLHAPPNHKKDNSHMINDDVKTKEITNIFTWSYCDFCQIWKPPRCHHCKICQCCILKRDHHCFMTGTCVGMRNQRFFILMCFYVTTALFYLPMVYRYITTGPHEYVTNWTDFVLPITIWRCLFHSLPCHIMLLISIFYLAWVICILGPGIYLQQMFCVIRGVTPHEGKTQANIICGYSINERFREVFGQYWALNWIFPMCIWFQPDGDGITWPYHRDGSYIGALKDL